MRLIKINPETRTVEHLDSAGNLNAMREAIGCQWIDVCARQDNGDALTVDDEALFLEPQPAAFHFDGYGPIHGIAILSGTDEEGETIEPAMSLEEATEKVQWVGRIHTEPQLTIVSWPAYFILS
jgi:hypothetical protein